MDLNYYLKKWRKIIKQRKEAEKRIDPAKLQNLNNSIEKEINK